MQRNIRLLIASVAAISLASTDSFSEETVARIMTTHSLCLEQGPPDQWCAKILGGNIAKASPNYAAGMVGSVDPGQTFQVFTTSEVSGQIAVLKKHTDELTTRDFEEIKKIADQLDLLSRRVDELEKGLTKRLERLEKAPALAVFAKPISAGKNRK